MKNDRFFVLTAAWLALVVLTLASLGLSESCRDLAWLPLAVAAIIWIKGWLVARCFIESAQVHGFIAGLLRIFIRIAPIALIVTAFFGDIIARWASL